MSCHSNSYTHVRYAWDDVYASQLSPLEALVYRSKTLGADRRIITSGGSTSAKTMEKDPITGEPVEVIWIKSSGQDLRASSGQHFLPLYQQKLVSLRDSHHHRLPPDSGARAAESLTERIHAAAFSRKTSKPSVDTPLHALMPYAHVNHIHPSSAIAVGACKNSRALTVEIWGEDMLWIPRKRPGVEQGIELLEAWSQHPNAKGALLAGNGIATWSDDNQLCYRQSLDIIEAASRYIAAHDQKENTFGGPRYTGLSDADRQTAIANILIPLRDLVSDGSPLVATVESGPEVMRFVNSADAPRLVGEGVSCMHHLRHTGLKPLYTAWDPDRETIETLQQRLHQGVNDYKQKQNNLHAPLHKLSGHDKSPTRQSAAPLVCLIPGVGLIAWGPSEIDSRITAEAYQSAIEVMRCAEAIDSYAGLPGPEALNIQHHRP